MSGKKQRGEPMIRMPDKESKNPLTKIASILKRKPGQKNEADGGEGENESDARLEEEKIKEIIKRNIVRY